MKKYRVAVIGRTGRGGYGHGLDVVWKDVPNTEVVAVADPDEKGRTDTAKKLSAKAAYADFRMMLEKEKPQLVAVGDRHLDLHRDMVVACARAGASVYMEKPMARTLAEADEMVKACQTHHVKLAIAHQTRYSPRMARLKELITSGGIGDVLEVRARGKEDGRGGGQDMMVLGTHLFDLMRFLIGDPAWCFARIEQGGKPATKAHVRQGGEGMGPIVGDHITATYGMPKNVLASFGTHQARHGKGKRYGMSLHTSKGVVVLGMGSLPPVWYCEDPTWAGRTVKWQEITSVGLGKPEPLRPETLHAGNVRAVKDLIEAIEKDRQPLGSGEDGRAALEMILAVYASHKVGVPVKLPLEDRKHPLESW